MAPIRDWTGAITFSIHTNNPQKCLAFSGVIRNMMPIISSSFRSG